MELYRLTITPLSVFFALVFLVVFAFLFWRYIWFFRNPPRTPPSGENIVSPADGTVVYAKVVEPHEEVVSVKQGVPISVRDILKEDVSLRKAVIGVFMSPFDVHYNRSPVTGEIRFIRHHPPAGENVHMGPMHLRTILGRLPHYKNSMHIVQNERTVTKIDGIFAGKRLPFYVVQIAGLNVRGIESYFRPGDRVEKGTVFGMIRIGSQVDLIFPWDEEMVMRVRPGQRVRAGETILVE
ncbi:MAG: phosphatidylserine decarboxylase [Deltaproteobacteria bacterium]|nr:phosphatidylserine decarboxylase [Deltaproteobacteria bacterium]